ncbi:MAG: YeiH family putative sulfate export transporter [Lachnospiraceae bacterium]|nr:YeiH family putative sulfate export transporter [Lachnospiraceae bacterium]
MKQKISGIVLCALIAGVATFMSRISIGTFSMEIIGAPVLSILMGMILSMICPSLSTKDVLKDGIKFTSKKILQWAVIILGFSLNLRAIVDMGGRSLPIIISTIGTSLLVAFIMMRLLKMNGKVSCLIGVGSSICGGSAIAATAPVIDADDEAVAQSISVIFLFNVIAALVFPSLGQELGFGSEGFAVFAGTAVNDTSSVTAVASTAEGLYGVEGILSAAVTVKLVRTLAIIPITLILAFYTTYKAKKNGEAGVEISLKKIFPWFILFFVGAAVLTTIVGMLSDSQCTIFYNGVFVKSMKWLAKFFIAMAMCAIGLNTNIVKLVKNGGKPIVMGFCCWVAIALVSICMQHALGMFGSQL